jgi:hypothetical protein
MPPKSPLFKPDSCWNDAQPTGRKGLKKQSFLLDIYRRAVKDFAAFGPPGLHAIARHTGLSPGGRLC